MFLLTLLYLLTGMVCLVLEAIDKRKDYYYNCCLCGKYRSFEEGLPPSITLILWPLYLLVLINDVINSVYYRIKYYE